MEFIKVETPFFDAKLIASKFHAAARETSRYAMNGVMVEIDVAGKVRVTSTDGHRLHSVQQAEFVDHGKDWFDKQGRSVLLPAKIKFPAGTNRVSIEYYTKGGSAHSVDSYSEPNGTVSIRYGKVGKTDNGYLENSGTMNVEVVDGTFPPYREVIPGPMDGGYQTLDAQATFKPDYLGSAVSFLGDFNQCPSFVQRESHAGKAVVAIGIPGDDGHEFRAVAVIMPVSLSAVFHEMRTLAPWFNTCEPE